jgi:DNA-binding IclR family transcriptional regulator
MNIARRSMVRSRFPRTDGAGVKSAERVLSIIELLTTVEQPMAFTAIHKKLGYPRSSLHGLLRTLVNRGWLETSADSRDYVLGIRAWEAGNTYARTLNLATRAIPYMRKVRDALDETVRLAVLNGRHIVYIAKVDGTQRLVLASEIGRRLEAHATALGKVLLAGLAPNDLNRRLRDVALERCTPNTITDVDGLKKELARVRAAGYARDNEEYTIGVRCVAVPVRNGARETVAAMSVSVPKIRFGAQRQAYALQHLRQAAVDLSFALGYRREVRPGGRR